MSGSTIDINGTPVTIIVANFTEAENFNFDGANWAPATPSVIEQNVGGGDYVLVEADIDLPGIEGGGSGPITEPFYGVTAGVGDSYSSGLLIPVAGATVYIEGYLEIDWVGIQNLGIISIAPGGTLQADVPIANTVISTFLGGETETGGTIVNLGTINSGNVISGGAFLNDLDVGPGTDGLISNDTTLQDLTFYGTLDLTAAHYNTVDLDDVTFGFYIGVAPEVLLNGTGGVLQSTGDETLGTVTVVFGSNVGTISSAGTYSTLIIGPSTTLDLDNTDFYVHNTDTLVNEIELDSKTSNQILSFAGQAYIDVIVNPNNGIYVPMAAGIFENADSIVLENAQAANTIFDIGFTNEAGAELSVTHATLADHQFTSTFENAGEYDIGSGGTVDAYDQSFINDADGVIAIGGDTVGAGALILGTMDIQSGGEVFTTVPSSYVNNGLIELDTIAPPGSSPVFSPLFSIGAGTTFTAVNGILFTNNGTIQLGAGDMILSNVTLNGGTIIGDGGTIIANDDTIENATLTGEVNLATQGGDGGVIWLYDDSYAANAFSQSIINVGQQDTALYLRDDFGLANLILNLGTVGDPRATLALESTTLTIEATSTFNIQASSAFIANGVIPNVSFLQTTLYNAGLMQTFGGVLDLQTTGFENAGQFTIGDDEIVNFMGASGTNLAGGQITIENGAEFSVSNASTVGPFTDAGGMLVEDGGYVSGLITLTANDPLSIAAGGILLSTTIVSGTISGDGGVAWSGVLDGVAYYGALTVAGSVAVENGTSFFAAGGAALPDTVNVGQSAIGGGTELAFNGPTTVADTILNIGNSLSYSANIAADGAVTFAAGVTINQTNTYAGIDTDGSGSADNQGEINANFLNGTFVVAGLTSFTNDGEINISNGDTFEAESPFTEAADGTLNIEAGGALKFTGGVNLAPGAVLSFAAGSTLDVNGQINGGTIDLNGADISGSSLPGSGVFDGVTINDTPVTISGTVTFIDVTYNGSPVVVGDLLLEGGNTFAPESAGPPPTITLIAGEGTIDFIGGQTLNNVEISAAGTAAAPAIIMAGSGASDAAVNFGAGLLIDQNGGGAAILRGTTDDLSSIDNEGSIAADQSAGTFTVQSLLGFTNDGAITVSNGDDFLVDAPFTENAGGRVTVASLSTLTVDAAMTIASGATVTLDPGSQLLLGQALTQGAGDGTSALVADGAVLQGTGEFAGVALLGSPTITGDLRLGAGDSFMSAPGTSTPPALSLNADGATLDVLTSQTLSGLNLSLGSPDSTPSGPATFAAGLGSVDASVTLAAGVTLTQSNAFALLTGSSDGASTIENDGQIDAEVSGGLFSVNSLANFTNTGDIEVQNGDSLNVGTTITNTGTIDDQSQVTFATAVTGTGTIMLGANATVTFSGPVATGQQIALNDGLVTIADPMAFSGTIDNFGSTDALWFPDETVNNPVFNNNQLTFTDASSNTITIDLQDSIDYPNEQMQEKSDNNGGFYVGSVYDQNLPCFAAGTRIATPRGEVPVEHLSAGDIVRLARGGEAEIVWIGNRRVDAARHPEPAKVWPVRVAAGAFGPGQPHHDLYLSPDHAVLVDDVLIPVKYLIDGGAITQVATDEIAYFHVELATHRIILAEGLPVESYLDAGDRAALTRDGSVFTLFPDFASRGLSHVALWEAHGCAPLVVHGAALDRARERLRRSGNRRALDNRAARHI